MAQSKDFYKVLGVSYGGSLNLFGYKGAKALHQSLDQAGIEHTYLETEGAHHWRVWRRYLRDVAPLLFKQATPSSKRTQS